MKAYFVVFVLFCSPIFLFCQTTHFGVIAGYNNATARYKPSSKINLFTMSIAGLQAGIYSTTKLNKSFTVTSNLVYNQKGNFVDDGEIIVDAGKRTTIKLNYIDLAIRVGYNFFSKKQFCAIIGMGTYFGVGIGGNEKGIISSLSGVSSYSSKIFFKRQSEYLKSYFRQYEIGGTFNASMMYKKYLVYLNYAIAINDRHFTNGWDYEARNKVFTIGVGYEIFNNFHKPKAKTTCNLPK